MGKVIEYNSKIEERKKICILKKEKMIEICGYKGKMIIYLNVPYIYNRENKNTFIKNIINYFKRKKAINMS